MRTNLGRNCMPKIPNSFYVETNISPDFQLYDVDVVFELLSQTNTSMTLFTQNRLTKIATLKRVKNRRRSLLLPHESLPNFGWGGG